MPTRLGSGPLGILGVNPSSTIRDSYEREFVGRRKQESLPMYDYQRETFYNFPDDATLNRYSTDGWDLVSFTRNREGEYFLIFRKLREVKP